MPNDVYTMVMMSQMITEMNNNTELMKKFMQRHIAMQKLGPSDIRNEMISTAMSGDKLRFNIYAGNVSI